VALLLTILHGAQLTVSRNQVQRVA
jgi:hypothetical protein